MHRMINRRTFTRASLLFALAAVTATAVAPRAAAAGSPPDTRFTLVGKWQPAQLPPGSDIFTATQSAVLTFDPDRRRMWVVDGSFPSLLSVYDSESRRPLTEPVLLPGKATATKVDPRTGRFLVAQTMSDQTHPATDAAPHLDAYAVEGGTLQAVWHADLTGLGLGTDIASLYVDTVGGSLYATWELNALAVPGLWLARFDLGMSAPVLRWTYALPPSCPTTPSVVKIGHREAPALGFSHAKQALYVLCAVPAEIARPPLLGGVGKVTLGAGGSAPAAVGGLTLIPVAGDIFNSSGSSFFDEVTGRLVFDVYSGSGGEEAVFDVAADRYVGMIDGGVNHFSGIGIDSRRGRLYGMAGGSGLNVADLRTTPPSQPTRYPDLTSVNPIAVDPAGGNVWSLVIEQGQRANAEWYIYHDTAPVLDVGVAADPDSNTTDIAEDPQTTGATYNASGQAFGVVAREVGGAESAVQDTENVFSVNGNSNPELRAAYVNGISLSSDAATASSIAADRDAQSFGGDQATLCGASPQPAQPATCPWPYNPAICSSFGTLTTGADSTPNGSATSSCSLLQRSASTSASLDAADLGEVTAASTSSSATILEDAEAGVRAEVTAEAHDVVALGGALHIAQVTTRAEAHAHGRPGTAGTAFNRDVEGVTLNGTSLCSSPCDLDVVAAEIDAAYSGRVTVSFPTPDPGFARGSPGGYQALVRLGDGQHLDDVFNSSQPADRVEVPGMVITIPIDGSRPSRTVISLAGVEAEARYGIYPLVQFVADQAGGAVPSGPPDLPGASLSLLPGGAPAALLAGSPGGAPAAAAAVVPQPVAAIPSILGWHGWQWALAHPGEFLRLLAVWLVFLIPVYLSARRWSLLRRHAIAMDLSA
jgi:hypothetical protein